MDNSSIIIRPFLPFPSFSYITSTGNVLCALSASDFSHWKPCGSGVRSPRNPERQGGQCCRPIKMSARDSLKRPGNNRTSKRDTERKPLQHSRHCPAHRPIPPGALSSPTPSSCPTIQASSCSRVQPSHSHSKAFPVPST